MKYLLFYLAIILASSLMLVDIATHNEVKAQAVPTVIVTKPAPIKDLQFDSFSFQNNARTYAKQYIDKGYNVQVLSGYGDILVVATKY